MAPRVSIILTHRTKKHSGETVRSIAKKGVANFNETLQFSASIFPAKKGYEPKLMELKLRQVYSSYPEVAKKKSPLLGKATMDLSQFLGKPEKVKLDFGNGLEITVSITSTLGGWKDKKLIKVSDKTKKDPKYSNAIVKDIGGVEYYLESDEDAEDTTLESEAPDNEG